MFRKQAGVRRTMMRIGAGATLSFGLLFAGVSLLELARAGVLFGWSWGTQPNQEVILLRVMMINALLLTLLMIRNLVIDFDVVTERLRKKLNIVNGFILSISIVALLLNYFEGPLVTQLETAISLVSIFCAGLTVYLFHLLVQVFRNVRDRLSHEQELSGKLYHQLTTDRLTGIPGRMLFQEHLAASIATAQKTGVSGAVLFFDLDDFKMFNDSLGHDFGDQVLLAVTDRILQHSTEGMRLYRLGGDEFVILLEGLQGEEEATQVAERVFAAMKEKLSLDGQDLFINLSLGISRFPEDGSDAQTLYRNAEMAMYHAKSIGRNNYQLFESAMNKRAAERLLLAGDLRRALERDEFFLAYQPQVCLTSGRITGMEALIRWQHPERGFVSPGEFIPLAEETKLIIPIGEWVLYTACRQNKAWQDAGFTPVCVSVNLSAFQFGQPNLVAMIKKVLEETGLEPQYLNLEITESITMNNVERAINTMHEINDLGIGISIDDFGTGYSSLNYLKKFPIQTLKIDQSFVRDMTEEHQDVAIPTAIIAMAHSLNLKVIAEGVETEVQQQMLRERGCDEMQGYLISRPLPALEFEKLFHSLPGQEQLLAN
ncbi:putative bifunctional diguanylate cyclase/phosphodiesterase [Tumebacillus algifaecis]|uniref:putative bifunctional diguanylate cyclase/phosphodiesterase n=1 Tax=Tumebacillus algifaecis TaxID=1214604 RepID=UPI00155F7FD8|nr:EAL domain-containing protein [Tumebacillus algifaecis]